MRIGINSPQDLMALLVRRRWWILVPFVALSGGIGLLTHFLPQTYVSETLILVRPRDVPEDFVMDLIEASPEERLKSIEQMILSRTNLVQILREFGASLPDFRPLNMDERVAKLREQIDIAFTIEQKRGSRTTQPLTNFRIIYQNQNPELAQKIASKLTTLFIEQDTKTRETQVFGTTEFLQAEFEKISQQLTESHDRLKDIKSTRQFELPEQMEANLRALDRLAADKKANTEALDRTATNRQNVETQLSQTPQFLPKVAPVVSAAKNPQVEEYLKAKSQFEDLDAKYSEKHPEVLVAKVRLERLKQQVPPEILAAESSGPAAEKSSAESAGDLNPLYQKLTAQLQEIRTEFGIREREKVWIESQIASYNRRIENTPKTEQEIAAAVRENDDLKKQYDNLKEKLSKARLAESLESKQKGTGFVVVDPANYPLTPAKPNKPAVLLAGTLLSLLVAIVFGAVVDIALQRVRTPSEIEKHWGVPVLVDIPEIVTDADLVVGRKKRVVFAASSLALIAVYSAGLYVVYLKHAFILRQLDPVIQKLVYR